MEGERNVVEDVVIMLLAIVLQIYKKVLFVSEHAMVLDVVVGHVDR